MSSTASASKISPSCVVVIGAGWTGLAAAKTYLQINPTVNLTILDEDSSIGGVWSGSRVYPGLVADSCAAIFDYSDFPMHKELDLDKWADLPAEKIHEYLERYADRFGLRNRCRLNSRVVQVTRDEEKSEWKVEFEIKKELEDFVAREVLVCDKLIVATGVTSSPNMPEGLQHSTFEGPVMHSRDVGAKHGMLTGDGIKRVTVVGGSKSAVDVVYLCALAGKEVDWVIREDGFGPILLLEPRTHGIHAGAIKAIRATALASPSILWPSGFWYRFLHSGKSKVGSKLLNWAMDKGSKSAIKSFYGRNENTMKLAPDMKDLFWGNSGASVIHDAKFMEMVASGELIHIHRASITTFAPTAITLSTGATLPSSAIVFATGWRTNQPEIFEPSLLPSLGLPYDLSSQTPKDAQYWEEYDMVSESRIRALFPLLDKPPIHVWEYDKQHERTPTTTPFRLFRGIAPPSPTANGDHSLIILGTLLNTAVPTYAELSALWGIAYLEQLPFSAPTTALLSSLPDMERAISLLNAWGWVRYRDHSHTYLDGSVEIQDFMDILMRDLGLEARRKRARALRGWHLLGVRAWVKEWLWPYSGRDYNGVVDEYVKRWGLGREKVEVSQSRPGTGGGVNEV